jgi:hypothetical protein
LLDAVVDDHPIGVATVGQHDDRDSASEAAFDERAETSRVALGGRCPLVPRATVT